MFDEWDFKDDFDFYIKNLKDVKNKNVQRDRRYLKLCRLFYLNFVIVFQKSYGLLYN